MCERCKEMQRIVKKEHVSVWLSTQKFEKEKAGRRLIRFVERTVTVNFSVGLGKPIFDYEAAVVNITPSRERHVDVAHIDFVSNRILGFSKRNYRFYYIFHSRKIKKSLSYVLHCKCNFTSLHIISVTQNVCFNNLVARPCQASKLPMALRKNMCKRVQTRASGTGNCTAEAEDEDGMAEMITCVIGSMVNFVD